jgi:hypothetical protein
MLNMDIAAIFDPFGTPYTKRATGIGGAAAPAFTPLFILQR